MARGSAVPPLSPVLSEPVAANLLTVARVRWGAAAAACPVSVRGAADAGPAPAEFMLLRSARFLAEDKAGRSSPARTAMTARTTSRSISVNAGQRSFIHYLVGFFHEIMSRSAAKEFRGQIGCFRQHELRKKE